MVTDINGYTSTSDTFLIITPSTNPPSIQISASATSVNVCTPVTFTATPANGGAAPSFQWQVSGVNVGGDSLVYSNNIFANGDKVICIMTTYAGCTSTLVSDTSNLITLSIDPQGHATVNIAVTGNAACAGSPVSFTASVTNGSPSPVFQWLVNGVLTGDTSATYSSSSLVNGDVIYCLVTSDASCGLAKSNSIPVTIYPQPVIPAGQVFNVPYGKSLTLDPAITGDIAGYLWSPGTGLSDSTIRDPVADPSSTTNYTLEVVSTAGCKASGTIIVDVYTPLSIPNAFTPNGDGRNDVFYILGGPEGSAIRDFAIFNRWGSRVFQVHDGTPGDPRFGWNGYLGGHPAPAGAYVYIVDLSLPNGKEQVYKGTVILIR